MFNFNFVDFRLLHRVSKIMNVTLKRKGNAYGNRKSKERNHDVAHVRTRPAWLLGLIAGWLRAILDDELAETMTY